MLVVIASCGTPLDFIAFFIRIFKHNWRFLNCYISTKLHNLLKFGGDIINVQSIYTFWYVNMPNLTASYGMFSDLMHFFWEFSNIISLERYNFIKLDCASNTVYLKIIIELSKASIYHYQKPSKIAHTHPLECNKIILARRNSNKLWHSKKYLNIFCKSQISTRIRYQKTEIQHLNNIFLC